MVFKLCIWLRSYEFYQRSSVSNSFRLRAARILIRNYLFRIRIQLRIRQKVLDPTPDPDPQHCLKGQYFRVCGWSYWPEVGVTDRKWARRCSRTAWGRGRWRGPGGNPCRCRSTGPVRHGTQFFFLEHSGGCNKCYQSLCWPELAIRIRMFLGLQDPYPLVKGTDQAPYPSLFS